MVALLGLPAKASAPAITEAIPDSDSEQYLILSVVLPSPTGLPTYLLGSCVNYVKFRVGDTSIWGSAARVQAYDLVPKAGMIVLTYEGIWGHAAYIELVKDGLLYVSETNYYPGQYSERTIPVDSPLIRGFK